MGAWLLHLAHRSRHPKFLKHGPDPGAGPANDGLDLNIRLVIPMALKLLDIMSTGACRSNGGSTHESLVLGAETLGNGSDESKAGCFIRGARCGHLARPGAALRSASS